MEPDETNSVALEPMKLRALECLLEGDSDAEVAQKLGVARVTVWRWRQEPAFLTELRYRDEQLRDVCDARLYGLMGKALTVVESVLDDPSLPPAVRLKAATEVLDRNSCSTPKQESARVQERLQTEFQGVFDILKTRVSPDAWREFCDAMQTHGGGRPPYSPLEACGHEVALVTVKAKGAT